MPGVVHAGDLRVGGREHDVLEVYALGHIEHADIALADVHQDRLSVLQSQLHGVALDLLAVQDESAHGKYDPDDCRDHTNDHYDPYNDVFPLRLLVAVLAAVPHNLDRSHAMIIHDATVFIKLQFLVEKRRGIW